MIIIVISTSNIINTNNTSNGNNQNDNNNHYWTAGMPATPSRCWSLAALRGTRTSTVI